MSDLSDDDLLELDTEFDDRRITPGRALLIALLIGSFFPWAWRFSPWVDRTPRDQLDDPAYSAAAEEICAASMVELDAVPSAAVAADTAERGEQVRAANGILEAMQRVDIDSPIVIRLDGTNAEEGRAILAPNLSDKLMMEETMLDAARKAVELAS